MSRNPELFSKSMDETRSKSPNDFFAIFAFDRLSDAEEMASCMILTQTYCELHNLRMTGINYKDVIGFDGLMMANYDKNMAQIRFQSK